MVTVDDDNAVMIMMMMVMMIMIMMIMMMIDVPSTALSYATSMPSKSSPVR